MAHHNIVFPERFSKGSESGWMEEVTIVRSAGGREQRNVKRSAPKRRFSLAHLQNDIPAAIQIDNFFRARRGRLHSFDFKDFTNYQATNETIGTGDGATVDFQLRRYVGDAGDNAAYEMIYRPKIASVVVSVSGSPVTVNSISVTGVATLAAAPAASAPVTWSGEFYYPVRFDMPEHMQSYTSINSRDFARIALMQIDPAEIS